MNVFKENIYFAVFQKLCSCRSGKCFKFSIHDSQTFLYFKLILNCVTNFTLSKFIFKTEQFNGKDKDD